MNVRHARIAVACCLLAGIVGDRLAESYIDRLPHRPGYYLVPVADALNEVTPQAPRHGVMIVVDGLRADHAERMASVDILRKAGQCRRTDVGPLSVSRPVYAVLSTGLEQDRTGVRNNDLTASSPVESIFQVARRAGRRVVGVSELAWFQQLFPDGFDRYDLVQRSQDHFTLPESDLGDLSLFLPIYVDENAHDFGAASSQYAAAVARADAEIGRLLSRLDLRRDLVVLTADHGHSDRGGHGGRSPEVAQVLTCFAGHGVRQLAGPQAAPIESRLLAPALATLLHLPFPRHMRAGQDSLDQIFEITDPAQFSPTYLAERRRAIERFRQANRQAVGSWLGRNGPAEWSELYHRQGQRQTARGVAVLLILAAGLAIGLRRQSGPRIVSSVLYCAGTCGLLVGLWIILRGSFDFTSVNERADFIGWAITCSILTLLCTGCAHFAWHRSRQVLAVDLLALLALLSSLNLAHIVAWGWPLGFPLPSPAPFFFPFLGGTFQAVVALVALGVCLRCGWRSSPKIEARSGITSASQGDAAEA